MELGFKLALSAAIKHSQLHPGHAHIGCAVLKNGEVVSVASNSPEEHAEVTALRGVDGKDCQKGLF